MTLDTTVYIHDPVNEYEVFHKCRELLGATDAHPYFDKDSWKGDGASTLSNAPGIGLGAWLMLDYRSDGPLRATADPHGEYCEDDCDAQHAPAAWLEVSFDTAYSYNEGGIGCGGLHAKLVAQLGQWLDERGISWSWQNEFTGQIHGGANRYERLPDLFDQGSEAEAWFQNIVLPAIPEIIDSLDDEYPRGNA